MPYPAKATTEEIIAAYQATGSVWKAARSLGMAGQSVHERLRASGHRLISEKWTDEEVAELQSLVGHVTVGEIARRLGRPYNGVAIKISRLGIGTRHGNRIKVKVPRGAGYDKLSVKRHTREIDATQDLVTRYARRNGLNVESLSRAIERHYPDWWEQYRREHSDLAEVKCEGCTRLFLPSSGKQRFCTRQCGDQHRRDQSYFGGKRSETIGLAEGVCQLCRRQVTKGLSSHHVLGKDNDPENLSLIALCPGCHKIITMLATRAFVDDNEAWEDLIALAWFRHHGADPGHGVMVTVELERLTAEEAEELNEAVERHPAVGT